MCYQLEWISGQHLTNKSPKDFLELIHEINPNWGLDENNEYLFKVINILKTRVRTINDIISYSDYFFNDPKEFDSETIKKSWSSADTKIYIKKYYDTKNKKRWLFL